MSTTWQDVIDARRATDEAQARLDAIRRETAPKIAEIRAQGKTPPAAGFLHAHGDGVRCGTNGDRCFDRISPDRLLEPHSRKCQGLTGPVEIIFQPRTETMIEGLVGLLVLIIVVGIVAYLLAMLLDMIPMDARFKQIARVLLILIAVLIILMRALPLLGVSI